MVSCPPAVIKKLVLNKSKRIKVKENLSTVLFMRRFFWSRARKIDTDKPVIKA